MQRAAIVAVVLLLSADVRVKSTVAQTKAPDPVFRPALAQIRSQTRIPILLPSKLPSAIHERDIKLAFGSTSQDGYFISLFYSETGDNSAFAAGFGASTHILQDLPNTHRVALSGGRTGIFGPVSCGGSCAPANLWWVQNHVMYQIQLAFRSDWAEKDQEQILVQTANSVVPAPMK